MPSRACEDGCRCGKHKRRPCKAGCRCGRHKGLNRCHGESRSGGRPGTPEYRAWISMIDRCYTPTSTSYDRYGAVGVTVCDEWRASYEAFLSHVGRMPTPGLQLDRIDNERGYEPGNVRWASRTTQSRNRRVTIRLRFKGVERPLTEWAELLGLDAWRIRARLRRGLSVREALSTRRDTGEVV